MKIFIQDRQTRLFYQSPTQWTNEVGQALDFPSALAAFSFSKMHSLGDTEVIFLTDDELNHQLQPDQIPRNNILRL